MIRNNGESKNLNRKGSTSHPSKIDRFSGQHTSSLIVGILFLATLISFVYLLCRVYNLPEIVIGGFISILSGLIGFFIGNVHNENNKKQ
jgi:hypothetical protein